MKKAENNYTGYFCDIDEMGRVVIPKKLRSSLDIKPKDTFNVFLDENDIILRKHHDKCIFCGSEENLKDFNGKMICTSCAGKISKL